MIENIWKGQDFIAQYSCHINAFITQTGLSALFSSPRCLTFLVIFRLDSTEATSKLEDTFQLHIAVLWLMRQNFCRFHVAQCLWQRLKIKIPNDQSEHKAEREPC